MHVAFKCPECTRLYRVGERYFNKGARCLCGAEFIIPAAEATADLSADEGALDNAADQQEFSSLNAPISFDELDTDSQDSSAATENVGEISLDAPQASSLDEDDLLSAEDESGIVGEGESFAKEEEIADFAIEGIDDLDSQNLDSDADDLDVEDDGNTHLMSAPGFAEPSDQSSLVDYDAGEKPVISEADEDEVADVEEEDKEELEDVQVASKSYAIPRIIAFVSALAVVAALFLPIWPGGDVAAVSSEKSTLTIVKGLEFFADGGQVAPIAYCGLGAAVLAVLLGFASILRIRTGMIVGILLTVIAVGLGIAGILPGLEHSSGIVDDPVKVYTQYFPEKLSEISAQVPGMLVYLGGLAVLLLSGLASSFTALRKQNVSAATVRAKAPGRSANVKKPSVVVKPSAAATITEHDGSIEVDAVEDIGDIADEFSADREMLDAEISDKVADEEDDVMSESTSDDDEQLSDEDKQEDDSAQDEDESSDLSGDDEEEADEADAEEEQPSESAEKDSGGIKKSGFPMKKKLAKKKTKKKAKKKVKKIGMKKKI